MLNKEEARFDFTSGLNCICMCCGSIFYFLRFLGLTLYKNEHVKRENERNKVIQQSSHFLLLLEIISFIPLTLQVLSRNIILC